MENRFRWVIGAAVMAFSALLLAGPPAAMAQLQPCTASLNVDIHYCKGLPPAVCDPLAFTDGMHVEISVEIANQSQFSVNPPPDPPAGVLFGGPAPQNFMKVYYSCNAATCAAGTELPGRFQFNSVMSIIPTATFSDDGNGYSGTLTFTGDHPFAQGDTSILEVVRLDMTAKQPPALPGEQVFARAGQPSPPGSDDSDNTFRITDPACLPNLLGGGQGTTSGLFGSPPGNDIGYCAHTNKQTIKIDRKGPLEYTNNRVSFIAPGYDPSLCGFDFGYQNANGQVATWSVNPGDISQAGPTCYIYQDKNAKNTGGPQLIRICRMPQDKWCVNFKGWDDFDANLTLPEMLITIGLPGANPGCGPTFSGPQPPPPPIWIVKPHRWILPKHVFAP